MSWKGKGKGKKRTVGNDECEVEDVDLFAKPNTRGNGEDEQSSNDTTDSEESVYSGLDEEESSEAESFEEMPDSMSDGSSDEDDIDEDEEEDESEIDADDSDESDEESEDVSSDEEYNVEKAHKGLVKHNNKNNNDTIQSTSKQKSKSKTSKKVSSKTSKSEGSENGEVDGTTKPTTVHGPDEYEFDSSDEEDMRNTVGNIPMEWYREYEHIGYNLLGQKIVKPASGDQLDEFLNKMDNPNYWRTVVDKTTGQNVVLSDKDVEMIKRMKKGKYVDPSFDPYAPWVDFFSNEVMQHPVTNQPAHKRSFIPSKWEKIKVGRMVHAIKMGWMKPKVEKKKEDSDTPNYYMLWESDEKPDITKRYRSHIPAPKMALPGHAESYNPPPEYLLTEEEELAWKDQDPEDRRSNFIPQKFSSLRTVPGYNRFINERFERCLDLYLCPRQRKMRMNVDPEDLLPKLPKPRDLQPFPTFQALLYKGHTSLVRCISVEPSGQWLVSGSDDHTLRFWEVYTGRCMKTLTMPGVVKSVVWNPNPSLCLVAAVVDETLYVINPLLGDKLIISNTDNMLESSRQQEPDADLGAAEWHDCKGKDHDLGFRIKITHPKALGQLTWHVKGDYMSVVVPGDKSKSVVIHQLSRRRSQYPFNKSKGLVQCVMFHPTRPFLFVATQRYVRVYNLLKQELTKKLTTNVKWISSMSVHPGGDNVIVGSYDCRLIWFDLDLSSKPYQILRHHKKAIRQVCYHKKYPLFASASDDGSVIICHGRVYNDLLQNPLIVPVKVLRGHEVKNSLGVLDCQFHPTQPWLFSSGRDNTIRLYT